MHRKQLAQCLPTAIQVPLPGPSQGRHVYANSSLCVAWQGMDGADPVQGKEDNKAECQVHLCAVGQGLGAEEVGEILMRGGRASDFLQSLFLTPGEIEAKSGWQLLPLPEYYSEPGLVPQLS